LEGERLRFESRSLNGFNSRDFFDFFPDGEFDMSMFRDSLEMGVDNQDRLRRIPVCKVRTPNNYATPAGRWLCKNFVRFRLESVMATAGYPPPQDAMYALNSPTRLEITDDARQLLRTPSPTPSEMMALKFRLSMVDWETITSRKFWFRREWLCAL
jgi:hypothetical protein